MSDNKKQMRGFALLSKEKVVEYAARGGRMAQASGRAHRFNSEEGRAAGKLGGAAAQRARKEGAN